MFYSSLFTKWCQYGYNKRMPKKTRKEKILSQIRKQNRQKMQTHVSEPDDDLTQKKVESSVFTPAVKQSGPETAIEKYFLNDLRKSLLITGAIFALEIFFYFATMNNYLDRYLNF